MDKYRFLETLEMVRSQWEETLALVAEDHLSQIVAASGMPVVALVAHITWYEREMLGVLSQRALAGSEWWGLPTHQRNAEIEKANRNRTWSDVRTEARQVYNQLLQALHEMEEQAYINPELFKDMPQDWQPWEMLAENTYQHYQQHLDELRAWLKEDAS